MPAASEASAYKTYEVRPLNDGESTYAGYTNTGVLTVTNDNEDLLDRFYVMKITDESGNYTWTQASENHDSWRCPTITEWPTFAGSFGIDSDNYYSTYGFTSERYWSSDQYDSSYAWFVDFSSGGWVSIDRLTSPYRVRLCTTF